MVRKLLVFSFFLLGIYAEAFAQYADKGKGVLQHHIWWFNWSGFTVRDGAAKTFHTTDGLTVTITFSNVTGPAPHPSVMNTWAGAVLHFLYDFSDPALKPALLADKTNKNGRFAMKISAARNGAPVPFTFVAADAEATAISQEQITLVTSGGSWRTLEFFRNSRQTSNPLNGCGTQQLVITDTYSGEAGIGQNPMVATDAPAGTPLHVGVALDRTRPGGSALAFGIFAPVDRGDLPAGYGYAQHALVHTTVNGCSYNAPMPGIIQEKTLYLGAVAGDADPVESTDDNAAGVDEEAMTAFPDYTGNGAYSLDVPVTNATGGNAFLTGWFDYNRNGVFDKGESVTALVPPNATTVALAWKDLPARFPAGKQREFAFRFRLSSDRAATESATGFAKDGEVEDYLSSMSAPCEIKLQSAANVKVCTGQSVKLTTSSGIRCKWSPADGLSDPADANPTASPAATTTYAVTMNDDYGCSGSANVTVTVNGLPLLSVSKSNDIDCAHGEAALHASGGVEYTWDNAPGITDLHSPSPIVAPREATTYRVAVTDANGCTSKAAITVGVDLSVAVNRYALPTAFTPNGDGRNDCFGLRNWGGGLQELDFNVYDRWGKVVFHAQHPNDCWDGTYKGAPVPVGAFVYVIKAKAVCGEVQRRGTLMLIR